MKITETGQILDLRSFVAMLFPQDSDKIMANSSTGCANYRGVSFDYMYHGSAFKSGYIGLILKTTNLQTYQKTFRAIKLKTFKTDCGTDIEIDQHGMDRVRQKFAELSEIRENSRLALNRRNEGRRKREEENKKIRADLQARIDRIDSYCEETQQALSVDLLNVVLLGEVNPVPVFVNAFKENLVRLEFQLTREQAQNLLHKINEK